MKPTTAAKKVANFARDETLEIFKEAKRQATVQIPEQNRGPEIKPSGPTEEEKQKLEVQRKRQIEALEKEIEDIRKLRQEKDEERKQREEEAMAAPKEDGNALIEPSTKRKKGLFKGMKGKVERMKRKTETRLPPSG